MSKKKAAYHQEVDSLTAQVAAPAAAAEEAAPRNIFDPLSAAGSSFLFFFVFFLVLSRRLNYESFPSSGEIPRQFLNAPSHGRRCRHHRAVLANSPAAHFPSVLQFNV